MSLDIFDYVIELENEGKIDPTCKTCVEIFYKQLYLGKRFNNIHAPRHEPSKYCQSGKRNHCTCDTCF